MPRCICCENCGEEFDVMDIDISRTNSDNGSELLCNDCYMDDYDGSQDEDVNDEFFF